MTLDEAIKHAEEVADFCEDSASKYDITDAFESYMACKDGKCADEHRQLAEWLRDYKILKEQQSCEDCISREEAILQLQRYGVGCFDADGFSVEQCTRFVISKLNELESVNSTTLEIKKLKQDNCENIISRQAVINAIEDDTRKGMYSCFLSDGDAQKFKTIIKELPSVTSTYKAIEALELCDWLAKEIFSEDWEYNKNSFEELACRKLEKIGIVKTIDGHWVLAESEDKEDD